MNKVKNTLFFVVVVTLLVVASSCEKSQVDLPPQIKLDNDTSYSAVEKIDFPTLVEQDDRYISDYTVLDPEDGNITASSVREYQSLGVATVTTQEFFYLVTKAGERWGWNSQEIEDFYRAIRPGIWKGTQKITVTDSGGNTVSKTRVIIGFFED